MEDRRHAIMQIATDANVTISYHTKTRKESSHPQKPPEKQSSLLATPTGKAAVGRQVSVEFYSDDSQTTTVWYKGTIISYNCRKGYIVSFDGCGLEDNLINKKSVQKGEVKLL